MTKKRTGLLLILLIFSICFTALPVRAGATETDRTIRIGYIDYEGFFDKQEDGSFEGYGVDYLKEISKYTGWNYEYVYDTWDNLFEMLKNGDIDFICHAQKTEEREENYLFSKYSDGAEASVLYVNKDDERYYYNDFESFNGMKIAVLKNSFQNTEFSDYASKKGFDFTFAEYDTSDKCFEALDNHQVDAVAMGSLALKSEYKIVCKFGSDPFYFITGKQNTDLMEELDDALGQITGMNPYFQADIYEKYYGSKQNATILYTREEMEFIQSAGEITVGLLPDREPLSYMDANGNACGMTVDLMNLVAEKSGLTFRYKFLENGQTGMDFLQNTDAELVAGVMESDFSRPNQALLVSDTLQNGSISFVGKNGTKFSPSNKLVVAIPAAFIGGNDTITSIYPNFTIYQGTTTEDCLDAISSGKADVMIQNMYVLRELLQSPKYDNMEIYPAYSFEENMKVVALDDHGLLMSILNKGIASITANEKNDVVIGNTIAKVYKSSFGDILYEYRYSFIGIFLLFGTCLGLLIVLTVYKQRNLLVVEKKNNQLAEAVAQADNANLAKSQFLARMSHEIRTPMNAIVGLTSIAEHHKTEPEKISEYLQKIDTSSKLLLNIINDVLDMSAIESNKIKIAESPFDISELLTSISTIYYAQCRQKGLRFEMITAGIFHEKLIGDSLRVNQILLNLISNAYKFTPEGGRIMVRADEVSERDGKAFITFMVEDTGEGMSEEMLSRLFKPFEQESAGTAKKHGGSGLGLSIAKNLVEMMSGSISVKSEKGKGTGFTVSIPFKIDESSAEKEKKCQEIRALVVGDDEESREYTSEILTRIGVTYEFAADGESAVEKLSLAEEKSQDYDICFVDWNMTATTGEAVTKQIREMFDKNSLVIVVSSYDTAEIQDEAIAAGADLFVTKPLFQSAVFDLLMDISGGNYSAMKIQEATYDFGGKRILLAEDVAFNAEIAIELLGMANVQVDHAENGEQAVEMFEKSEPGTYVGILMDVQMPKMDGYEATERIRSSNHAEAKTIQIYAMTANAFTEDVSNALNAGMNGHIAKPIDNKVLYETIKKMVEKGN